MDGFRPNSATEARLGWLLATPAALTLLVLILGPSLLALALSFTDFRLGIQDFRWVGIENYRGLASEAGLRQSILNTIIFVAVVAPISIFGALWVAILIAGLGRLGAFFQTTFFLPVTATLVAMATAWEVLLHPTFGIANSLLTALGFEPQRFLSDPDLALWTLALIAIWKMLGYNVLLFLAGLSTIDPRLYEAATLDGAASGWKRFVLVTRPMLAPVMLFVTVITLIRAFSEFELVAVLTNGGPDGATEMVLFTLYQEAFRFFDIGKAAALAVFFLAVVMTISVLQIKLADKRA